MQNLVNINLKDNIKERKITYKKYLQEMLLITIKVECMDQIQNMYKIK